MYFLKEKFEEFNTFKKFEEFNTFKKFKALVEKESAHNIKAMRSNKGGELTTIEFEEYSENHGIHWLLIVPYPPQQNGIIERKK